MYTREYQLSIYLDGPIYRYTDKSTDRYIFTHVNKDLWSPTYMFVKKINRSIGRQR